MKYLSIRLACVAVVTAALVYACGSDSESPSGPASKNVSSPVPAETDCGAADYLSDLSPVLGAWEDSIEAWLGEGLLDTPPTYSEGSEPEAYLAELVPVLQQWEMAVNGEFGSEVLDSVPDFDPWDTGVPEYLVGLSPLLFAWQASLEEARGEPFLPEPPVFLPDTAAPVVSCPGDTTVDCADSSGAVVDFEATATDNCDPSPKVTCDPPSGSTFPLGETSVTCTAIDSAGNSSQCTFTLKVEAAEPPLITCPADTTVECAGTDGTVVEFGATATSECDDSVVVSCEPPSGSAFPLGTTQVTCRATDSFGNASECTFEVLVEDTTPPEIREAAPSRSTLWPPNHKMVEVDIFVDAEDICDSTPTCFIVDVTSNEDVDGLGDGNTEPDWRITGELSVELRAERSGKGSGRVYYVLVRCEDDSGNGAEHTVEVVVPHDQRPNSASQ